MILSKVKLATIVEGDPKAPFSIATTPRRYDTKLHLIVRV